MKGKLALTVGLWIAMGGPCLATARAELPQYPTLEEPDELQVIQQRLDAQEAEIASIRAENQRLRTELANVAAIDDYVSLVSVHGRPTVRFSEVNVQVVNGTGDTNAPNGTGNLLIGYDALRQDGKYGGGLDEECSLGTDPNSESIESQEQCGAAGGTWALDHKGGSHYLVVGDGHNYTQWSGIVSGMGSTANSPWASVTGGYYNRATGVAASVTGGAFGVAAGGLSSVGGGYENRAGGSYSSVSGGWGGMASGLVSSVTGGGWNEASGIVSSVTGGNSNDASADSSSVSGGSLNHASGYWSSVSGGANRTAADTYGWAGGVL